MLRYRLVGKVQKQYNSYYTSEGVSYGLDTVLSFSNYKQIGSTYFTLREIERFVQQYEY